MGKFEFSDNTYAEFFQRHKVDIHGSRYQRYGSSEVKKLRAFWDEDPDSLVGAVLSEMLDIYEANCELNGSDIERSVLDKARSIVSRLTGSALHFRNYIHPYQQMVSGFTPDEHTAKVCFQVLKAALASVAGER